MFWENSICRKRQKEEEAKFKIYIFYAEANESSLWVKHLSTSVFNGSFVLKQICLTFIY